MNQKTIAGPFSLSGLGLHSGEKTSLLFKPAEVNAGIVFYKAGLKIPATVSQVIDTSRGTSLNGVAVVEHLLSALSGLGIDNLEIHLTGNELPALDGSALPYIKAFENAGIMDQASPKKLLVLSSPLKVISGNSSLEATPYRGFRVNFMVDFQGVGAQTFSFDFASQNYRQEIAPARTFGYLEEYEALKAQGLARGASIENALILGKSGFVTQPRFSDEVVRHKILDLIGDLSLLGQPLQAEITGVKSGHQLNIELVRKIILSKEVGDNG